MKKLTMSLLILILLVGCSSQVIEESDALQTLKCEYVSETLIYDNILKIKNDKIMASVLTVYTETSSSKEDVLESIDALFKTKFVYHEQDNFKILTSILDVDNLSLETKKSLLLDTLSDSETHTLEEIIKTIEDHENKNDLSVTCALI